MSYRFFSEKVFEAELYGDRGKVLGRRLLNTGILLITKDVFKGQFAVQKWHKSQGRMEKRFQLISSIYLVHRQAINILNQYNIPFYGEKVAMRAAIEVARDLNLAIIDLNKGNAHNLQRKLNEKVEEIFRIVGRVRNSKKQAGLKIIEPIIQGADCQGRVNPGAFRARTVGGINRFQERESDILKIEGFIIKRLASSKALFDYTEYLLASSIHFLNAILEYALEREFRVDHDVQKRMAGRLKMIVVDLETINFQPFTANCELSASELRNAVELIRIGDIREAIFQISISLNSLRLKEVQGEIEDIILEITALINGQFFSIEAIESIAKRLFSVEGKLCQVDERDFQVSCVKEALEIIKPVYLILPYENQLSEVKDVLKNASKSITLMDLRQKLA